ncbi:MAG: cytochrome b/b6 domain-containing protein [Novosphingobium sp.]
MVTPMPAGHSVLHQSEDSGAPYPLALRLIHWFMALTIIGLISLGLYMTSLKEHSEELYFWHKSFGMLAFFLILLRMAVRARSRIPGFPLSMQPWERKAAAAGHGLLYLLMLLVPLAGYTDSSAYVHSSGIHFFVVDLPQLIPDNEQVQKIANLVHKLASYALAGLLVVHVSAALKHRYFDRDRRSDVFPRILIRWRRRD